MKRSQMYNILVYIILIYSIFHFSNIQCNNTEQEKEEDGESEREQYSRFMFLDDYCNRTSTPPRFKKLILFIVDALRVDFIPTIQNSKSKPRLPFLEQTIRTNGVALQNIASIPTVTLPRIKTLLSGTMPSFIDYIYNLNAYRFQSDNILQQFHQDGKRIVFYGDDTWGNLFPPESEVFTRFNLTSSFFVTDYVEVDTNVTYNLRKELKQLNKWDVMILHYLGLDHIGHSHGYYSTLIPDKLLEMDQYFKELFETLRSNPLEPSLIVFTGDHGMTNAGNHGGETHDETHTPLIFISTDNHSHRIINYPLNEQPIEQSMRTYLQNDLAPTISSLFQMNIPQQSQGRLISPVFDRFGIDQSEHLCSLFRNSIQIQHIIKIRRNPKRYKNVEEFNQLKQLLYQAIKVHYKFVQDKHKVKEISNKLFEKSLKFYQQFLNEVQHKYIRTIDIERNFLIYCITTIVILLTVIAMLFRLEYLNQNSIIFRLRLNEPIKNDLFGSIVERAVSLTIIIGNGIGMGSTNFMQNEHLFWNIIQLTILFVINIKKYGLKLKWNVLVNMILYFLIIKWKIIIQTNQWGDQVEHQSDIHFQLERNPTLAMFTFLFSLFMIQMNFNHPIKLWPIYAFVQYFIFSYRYQTYSLIDDHNRSAQIVYWIIFLLFFFEITSKILSKLIYPKLESVKEKKNITKMFLKFWVVIASLTMDPLIMPMMACNILMERFINECLNGGDHRRWKYSRFVRLAIYYSFAHGSFYQIGNTNSLSTVNVSSCYIGLNSYQIVPCTILMINSIYSTYIFWIFSFFARIYDEERNIVDHSMRKYLHESHDRFNSTMTCWILFRFSMMACNLIVTLILREHSYIWSVILPKMLYEVIFTGLVLLSMLINFAIFYVELYATSNNKIKE